MSPIKIQSGDKTVQILKGGENMRSTLSGKPVTIYGSERDGGKYYSDEDHIDHELRVGSSLGLDNGLVAIGIGIKEVR